MASNICKECGSVWFSSEDYIGIPKTLIPVCPSCKEAYKWDRENKLERAEDLQNNWRNNVK